MCIHVCVCVCVRVCGHVKAIWCSVAVASSLVAVASSLRPAHMCHRICVCVCVRMCVAIAVVLETVLHSRKRDNLAYYT